MTSISGAQVHDSLKLNDREAHLGQFLDFAIKAGDAVIDVVRIFLLIATSKCVPLQTDLKHITSPFHALKIVQQREFRSFQNPGHYDAGANFLGILGLHPNTCPAADGATLTCTWIGEVSAPLHWEDRHVFDADVLFDFNGSGAHFQNNDPRYFLPYGSTGLILNKVQIPSEDALLLAWSSFEKKIVRWVAERGWFRSQRLVRAHRGLEQINEACSRAEIILPVRRAAP